MSEGVTEALRGWIRAYDLWLNEGEGEAPTVDSLCEVADAIDLAAQDEVHERVVRCRDCVWFGEDTSDHEYRSGWWCSRLDFDTVEDGFCHLGDLR